MTTSTSPSSAGTTREDRQRQRAERGLKSSAAAAASRSSQSVKPPRRRRPMVALLAVLLIVGGAAVAGLLAVRMDSRVQVLVVGQDIAPGEEISAAMLRQVPVASEGLMLVPADQAEAVIGTYARVPLRQGQLLDTSMLTTTDPIVSDTAVVGVPLQGGRVPPGLQAGDLVRLVRIGEGATTGRPLATGLVMRTETITDEGLVGEGGATTSGKLLVPAGAADAVVDAAGNERIGLALLQRGVAIDEVELEVLGAD